MSNFVISTVALFSGLLIICCFGGLLGYLVGELFLRVNLLTRVMRRFWRIALWFPLLMLWPLPVWFHAQNSTSAVLWALGIGISTVAASVVYNYLSISTANGSKLRSKLEHVSRSAVIQGLLVTLILHVRLWSSSWFPVPGVTLIPNSYIALVILGFILFWLDSILVSDPEEFLETRRRVILHELGDTRTNDVWQTLFLGGVFLLVWWLIGVANLAEHYVSPGQVVAAQGILIRGAPVSPENETIWRDMGTSLLGLLIGLTCGGTLATLTSSVCRKKYTWRILVLRVLRSLNIIIMMLPLFILVQLQQNLGIWLSISVVALISFCPFLETLLTFDDSPRVSRILLGLEVSLPYAVVGLLFGESVHAVSGLGLYMIIASARGQMVEGFAIAAIVVCLFVISAVSIRAILRRAPVIQET